VFDNVKISRISQRKILASMSFWFCINAAYFDITVDADFGQ